MSKSLNNIYTIDQLAEMGYNPMDFKYFCLNTYYGKKINFTFDALKAANSALKKLHKSLNEHKQGTNNLDQAVIDDYKQKFLDAINDDLNTPLALGVVWTALKEPASKQIYQMVVDFDRALGLQLDKDYMDYSKQEIPEQVVALAEQRKIARQNKDFAESDRLRDEISKLGFSIKDTREGYEITSL